MLMYTNTLNQTILCMTALLVGMLNGGCQDASDSGADTTSSGGNTDGGTMDTAFTPAGGYRFLRIFDSGNVSDGNFGQDIDAITHDDGTTQRPASKIAACNIGRVPNPARSDCNAVLGAADATGDPRCLATDTALSTEHAAKNNDDFRHSRPESVAL